jgi:hypothetical protein
VNLWLVVMTLWLAPAVKVVAVPRVVNPNQEVRVMITIEPHEDNREACLVWDDGFAENRSCWTLDGANAPRTSQQYLKHLAPGEYAIQVRVRRPLGGLLSNIETIRVLGLERKD